MLGALVAGLKGNDWRELIEAMKRRLKKEGMSNAITAIIISLGIVVGMSIVCFAA